MSTDSDATWPENDDQWLKGDIVEQPDYGLWIPIRSVHPSRGDYFIAMASDAQCADAIIADHKDAAAAREAEHELRNLLAIIHRDGGHYATEHGLKKAVDDAHLIWADLRTKAEALEKQP